MQAALKRSKGDRRRRRRAASEGAHDEPASSGNRFRKRKSDLRAGTNAGGGGDPGDGDGDDDPADAPKGPSGRDRFRRRRRKGDRKGGLRSGASRLLDKAQAKVERQLFQPNADIVAILTEDVPIMSNCVKIPLPGKAQALTTSANQKHVISINEKMQAVLAEKTYSSFEAFDLAELMRFRQLVEYVASCQDCETDEDQDRVDSVVEAVRVIADNSIRVHNSMREAGTLGEQGENFRAYTYIQVYYLVMFREAFDGAMAEMFFMTYAANFAVKARGCPGMGRRRDPLRNRARVRGVCCAAKWVTWQLRRYIRRNWRKAALA